MSSTARVLLALWRNQDPVCLVAQVQCGDQLVERVIEEKIDQFYGWVEKHPGRRGQVGSLIHNLTSFICGGTAGHW